MYYEQFAKEAGCGRSASARSKHKTTFDCLVAAPSETLQTASGAVSASGIFGTFAFLPVVDGDMIRARPSVQLLTGQISGRRILVGVGLFPSFFRSASVCCELVDQL